MTTQILSNRISTFLNKYESLIFRSVAIAGLLFVLVRLASALVRVVLH